MATSLPKQLNLQLHNVRFSGAFAWGWFLLVLLATPGHSLQQMVTYRPVDANGSDAGKFIITCKLTFLWFPIVCDMVLIIQLARMWSS